MDDVIYLISETVIADSIGVYVPTETKTLTYATVRTVNRAEWQKGGANGLAPEYVFETDMINYSGEKLLEYNSVKYSIYRTYFKGDTDTVELYAERKSGV